MINPQLPTSKGFNPPELTHKQHQRSSKYCRSDSHNPANPNPAFVAAEVLLKLDSRASPYSAQSHHREHTKESLQDPSFQEHNTPPENPDAKTFAFGFNSAKKSKHQRLPLTHRPGDISCSDSFTETRERETGEIRKSCEMRETLESRESCDLREIKSEPSEYTPFPTSTFFESLASEVSTSPNYDFALDAMEFIEPSDLGHESRAFPPSEFPDFTPALGPIKTSALPPSSLPLSSRQMPKFQSPILPSQNTKSYNKEHLMHKQRQKQRKLSHTEGAFTPLGSPAVTPLQTPIHGPAKTEFEPLTSPALKAQSQAGASNISLTASSRKASVQGLSGDADRRRLSSAAFAASDYSQSQTHTSKRRTPHSTPQLAAVSSKIKQEPSLGGVHNLCTSELTPMLPPQGRTTVIDSELQYTPNPAFSSQASLSQASPAAPFEPGTMMGFTMNRLAQQQMGGVSKHLDLDADPQSDIHLNRTSNHPHDHSSDTSPSLEHTYETSVSNGDGICNGKRDRSPGKKTSHKMAELGRRMRMNQAVQELSSLIPDSLQENIAVPSKATTIELAAMYIRTLQRELQMKKDGESS